MDYKPKVLFMPIGELRSDEIKTDLKAAKTNLEKIDFDLTIMPPLFNEKKVIEAARRLKAEGKCGNIDNRAELPGVLRRDVSTLKELGRNSAAYNELYGGIRSSGSSQ